MTWLNNARIAAVFAVVFLHVAGSVLVCQEISSEYWWHGNIYESLTRWCVPVLVMISGALLLASGKRESTAEFYGKRFRRIGPRLFSGHSCTWH